MEKENQIECSLNFNDENKMRVCIEGNGYLKALMDILLILSLDENISFNKISNYFDEISKKINNELLELMANREEKRN